MEHPWIMAGKQTNVKKDLEVSSRDTKADFSIILHREEANETMKEVSLMVCN